MSTKCLRSVCLFLVMILCVTLLPADLGAIYAESNQEQVTESTIHEITLDGRGVIPSPASIAVDTAVEDGVYEGLPDLTGGKKNYDFKGWFTANTGGREVKNGDLINVPVTDTEGNVEIDSEGNTIYEPIPSKLYARWEGCKYTVTLDPCRATLSKKSISVSYGGTYSSLPTPTRKGLVFMGWYTSKTNGTQIKKTSKVTLTKNIKLYAKWAPKWYFQTDKRWKNRWYRVRRENSTIGNAGCGPTTMAMVVSSIKNNSVNPIHACAWSRAHGYKAYKSGTKDGFFKSYGKKYGIKVTPYYAYKDLRYAKKTTKTKYNNIAKNAVKNGNWVIVLVGKSRWTKGGHFILWYKTEGGYAYIRDSNSASAARAKAPVSTLQKAAKRYWVVSVPASKKVN